MTLPANVKQLFFRLSILDESVTRLWSVFSGRLDGPSPLFFPRCIQLDYRVQLRSTLVFAIEVSCVRLFEGNWNYSEAVGCRRQTIAETAVRNHPRVSLVSVLCYLAAFDTV